jgi:acetyl-CoA carboxylase biotin carboxyl carrier protein
VSGISGEDLKALIDAFDRSDWQEMTFTVGSDTLHLSRDPDSRGPLLAPAPPCPVASNGAPEAASTPASEDVADVSPAPPAAAVAVDPSPAAPQDAGGMAVESPSVGLFWQAPAPGAPPFVEVGAHVAPGDVIGIVEVMKLMNHVTAPTGGTVTAVLVENGASVEFGQPLVLVEPDA